jgi:hypothetical protein
VDGEDLPQLAALLEEGADLGQPDAELAEAVHELEPGQVGGVVAAVARFGPGRLQDPEVGVEADGLDREPAQLRQPPDAERGPRLHLQLLEILA